MRGRGGREESHRLQLELEPVQLRVDGGGAEALHLSLLVAHLLERALLHHLEHRPCRLPKAARRGIGGGGRARGRCRAIARLARRARLVAAAAAATHRGGEKGKLAELRVDGATEQRLRAARVAGEGSGRRGVGGG